MMTRMWGFCCRFLLLLVFCAPAWGISVLDDGSDGSCTNAWPPELLGNYNENGAFDGYPRYEGPNGYHIYNVIIWGPRYWVVSSQLGSDDWNNSTIRFYVSSSAGSPPETGYSSTNSACGRIRVGSGAAPPPSAPTLTGVSDLSGGSITAYWLQVSGAVGYKLDVALDPAFTQFVPGYNGYSIDTPDGQPFPPTSHTLTGLSGNGVTYYFRLRAYNGSGESANSSVLSRATLPPAPDQSAPDAITSIGFRANWLAANGATGYQVQVCRTAEFTDCVAGYNPHSIGSDVTSHTASGMDSFSTYYVRVRATNAAGSGAWSNSRNLTTVAAPVFSGAEASQPVGDDESVSPFAGVTIAKADGLELALRVTLTPSDAGTFTAASLAESGFVDNGGGVYQLGSTSAGIATAAVRQLVFQPVQYRLPAGGSETVGMAMRADFAGEFRTDVTTTVVVSAVNVAPTEILLSNASVAQSGGVNAPVGELSALDPNDGDVHMFAFSSGPGDDHNNLFNLSGTTLRANDAGELAGGSYSVRLVATDAGGLEFSRSLAVEVIDDIPPGPISGTLQVAENPTNGTIVGQIESADATNFTLTDDAGGRFAILFTGVVTVANGLLIDFETAQFHTIGVRAFDEAGNCSDGLVQITVVDVNDLPELDLDPTSSEDGDFATLFAAGSDPVVLAAPDAKVEDEDAGAQIHQLVATIDTTPDGPSESLMLGSEAQLVAAGAGLNVTYSSVDRRLTVSGAADPAIYQSLLRDLRYANSTPAADTTDGDRTIEVVVSDGELTSSPRFSVVSVVPVVIVDLDPLLSGFDISIEYIEGSGPMILGGTAEVSMPIGRELVGLTITLENPQDAGEELLTLLGITHESVVDGIMIDYVTAHRIELSGAGTLESYRGLLRLLTYTHASQSPEVGTLRSISIRFLDDSGFYSNLASVLLTVEPVNDAPTLVGGDASLGTLDGLVSEPIMVASFLNATDPDADPLKGIAVHAVVGTGFWEYSTDGGASWAMIAPVEPQSALFLHDDHHVRYRRITGYPEVAGILYRAWDRTSGSAGERSDTSSYGGTTAFSANVAEGSLVASVIQHSVAFDIGAHGLHVGGGPLDQMVVHAADAIEPIVEPIEHWRFLGWDAGFVEVTSDLWVTAQYDLLDYTVEASSGGGGNATPGVQSRQFGQKAIFEVVADPGYLRLDSVNGDCPPGTWDGDVYTTGTITGHCRVEFEFGRIVLSAIAPGGGVVVAEIDGGGSAAWILDEDQPNGLIPMTGNEQSPTAVPPQNVGFPFGLLEFTLHNGDPGQTATITITYPTELPKNAAYWKYDRNLYQWYSLPKEAYTIDGHTVVLTLRDGGHGDHDGTANGRIVDPGGIGIPGAAIAIPTLSRMATLVLVALIALIGMSLRRRA